MRIRDILISTSKCLATIRCDDSWLEAEVLLRHVLSVDRAYIFSRLEDAVSDSDEWAMRLLVQRRVEGEPLAYLVGSREFYGLGFVVTPAVLIPRQETELLVDIVLRYGYNTGSASSVTVADVGTGSGAIAMAVAHKLPKANVFALDISKSALEVADINRLLLGVADRVHLLCGDLLTPLSTSVDIIVSNPPYIRRRDISDLHADVRREPLLALDGGVDGLYVTRRLLRQAQRHLAPCGILAFEISPDQLHSTINWTRRFFPEARIFYEHDLRGYPRAVVVETGQKGAKVPNWHSSNGGE